MILPLVGAAKAESVVLDGGNYMCRATALCVRVLVNYLLEALSGHASTGGTSHTNLITSFIRYGAIASRASLCRLQVTRRKARDMRGFNKIFYGDSRFLDPQNALDTLESRHKRLVGLNSPAIDPPR